MKKIVILFFSIFSLFAQDIQKEVKDYASQHSNNVCCNDLLNLFKIKPDLGKYGPLADLIFSKLCIQTDENNMTVLSNGIEIAGKTSFKEKLIDA